MRDLVVPSEAVARHVVEEFVGAKAGLVVMHLAAEALRQLETARLSGAMQDEVRFEYRLNVEAFLR